MGGTNGQYPEKRPHSVRERSAENVVGAFARTSAKIAAFGVAAGGGWITPRATIVSHDVV
jgi:hypothetical protein